MAFPGYVGIGIGKGSRITYHPCDACSRGSGERAASCAIINKRWERLPDDMPYATG